MTERVFDDLGAWEAGERSLADVERTHATEPIRGLVALHRTLAAIAEEPVPDAAAGWIAVRERMDVRRPSTSRRVRHVIAGALVAAVLSASAAFATPGVFHAVVDGVHHGVHSVFGGNPAGSHIPSPPGLSIAADRPGHGHVMRPGPPIGPSADPNGRGSGSNGGHGGGPSDHGTGSGQGDGGGGVGSGSGSDGGGGSDHGGGSDRTGGGSSDGTGGGSSDGGGSDQHGGGSGSGDQASGSGDQGSGN
jgi:hypothetical protein